MVTIFITIIYASELERCYPGTTNKSSIFATTGWGIQRRLNKIGYIDVSVRLNTTYSPHLEPKIIDFEETINLEIGFGASFKKQK